MLKAMRRAWLWTRALALEHDADFSGALERLRQMDSIMPLRPLERAKKATLILRKSEYREAEKQLRAVVHDLESESTPNRVYTRLYCEHILATIDGDLSHERTTRERALALKCSTALKRWLPLE